MEDLLNSTLQQKKIQKKSTKSYFCLQILFSRISQEKYELQSFNLVYDFDGCAFEIISVEWDRLTKKLDSHQSVKQTGFRMGFDANDHLQIIKTVIEKQRNTT